MNDLNLAIKLTTEGGKVIVKDFTSIRDAAESAGRSLDATQASGAKAASSLKKTGSTAKNTGKDFDTATLSVNKMYGQLQLLVGGVSLALLSNQVKNYADTWKLANNQLKLVTDSEDELTGTRQVLLGVAQDTNTELLRTIELYASFSRGTKTLGISQEDVIGLTRTMNNLLLAGGKSAQETSGAIRQLNQGLESGALRGDEFNSVAEGAPRVLDALSISLGMARGELREFAATGGITAEILATALIAYDDTAQQMADATERTFDQQITTATNNITAFVGQSEMLNSAVSNTGAGLVTLSENIEALTNAAGAAALVYTASFIPGIVRSVSAQITQITTARALSLAMLDKAKVTAAAAAADLAAIEIARQRTAGFVLNTAAVTAYTNAQAANTAATAGLATAQAAATRTSYALGVATRFLLGPFGLLLTVVGAATAAFYLSAEASEKDAKAKEKQAERLKMLLGIHNQLRKEDPAEFGERYVKAQKNALEIDNKLIAVREKLQVLNSLSNQSSDFGNIIEKAKLYEEFQKLTKAQSQNNDVLKVLKKSMDEGVESLKGWEKPAEEVTQFTSSFNEELQELIDTLDPASAALRKYGEDYDVLLGAVADGGLTYEESIRLIDLLDKQYAKQTETVEDVVDKNAAYIDSLKAQLSLGKLVGEKLAIETALRKLNADATAEQKAETERLTKALFGQNAANKAMDLTDLTNQVNDYGSAWSNVGDTIVDAFGSISAQLEQFTDQQESYAASLDEIAQRRALIGENDDISFEQKAKSLEKLATLENKLTEQNLSNQLGAYGSMAGAASKMFDEQSKGREALHRVEQVFTAIEIGLALQKAAANALTAITTQGQGDPYTAFGRIAAMAAIMAGLGVFSGSVSGGSIPTAEENQANQGTGSVLGDSEAKSGSISASADRFEDIAIDQLAELIGIHDSMRDLNNGIASLAQSLVSGLDFNGGDISGQLGKEYAVGSVSTLATTVLTGVGGLLIDKLTGGLVSDVLGSITKGLFGSTKKTLVDSGISFLSQTLGEVLDSGALQGEVYNTIQTNKKKLFGLIKSESTDIEYSALDSAIEQQIGAIYGHIGDSALNAATLLGFETVERTQTEFVANFEGADFDYLDGSINKWFGGYFDTVTTTTTQTLEEALADFDISLPKISFNELSGEEIQAELEAVFSQQADAIASYLVPSITEYQQLGEGAYETLLRVAQEQVIVNDHFDRMGVMLGNLSNIELIDVSQNIIELSGGLEAFQDASNTFFTEFYSEAEQFEQLQKSLTDVLATMNLALPESKQAFRDLVEGLDVTTEEGQRLFATLLQISPAAADYYDQLKDGMSATENATNVFAARIAIEKDWATQVVELGLSATESQLRNLSIWYDEQLAIATEAGASTVLLERLYATKRQTIMDSALAAINAETQTQLDALTNEHNQAVDSLTSDYQALFDVIGNASSVLAGALLTVQKSMRSFNEVAYQTGEVDKLRGQLGNGDIAQQAETIEQLITAITSRYTAQLNNNNDAISATEQLVSEHENAVSSLTSTYNQLFSSINSVSNSVSAGILSIQRSQSGFSEVDYQASQIANLQSQLGQGDIDAQAGTVQSLVDATLAKYNAQISESKAQVDALNAAEKQRYSAEIDHYNDLVNAANAKYQSELAQYEALKKAADNLKATADSLLFGDLSYLSAGDQRSEAQSQYDNLLARAQSGDADAASQLNSFSKQFLEINKDYLGGTGSSEFGDLFDQVQADLRGFNAGAAPSRQALPAAPREVVQYQVDNLALQTSALNELADLQTLLDDLNTQAAEQQKLEAATLETQLADINATLMAQQAYSDELAQNTITELSALQLLLADLNTQAIVEQTAGLDSLKLAFDASVTSVWVQESEKLSALESSAALNAQNEIDAIYDMQNSIVAAINNIDVAPVVIEVPAAVTSTPNKVDAIKPETYPNPVIIERAAQEQAATMKEVVSELKAQSKVIDGQKAALTKMGRGLDKVTDSVLVLSRIA